MNEVIAAKAAFKQRVHEWAAELDVEVVWLGVRPMRNKWASCSTNGHLNFNSDLLDLEIDLWDYVIVHELLHFSVPSSAFMNGPPSSMSRWYGWGFDPMRNKWASCSHQWAPAGFQQRPVGSGN